MLRHRLLTLLVTILAGGCTSESEDPRAPGVMDTRVPNEVRTVMVDDISVDFATPEATFHSTKTAILDGQYEAFCHCWTDDGKEWLAGAMAVLGNMVRGISATKQDDDAARERSELLTQLFEKHGYPDGKVPNLNLVAGENAPKPMNEQVREQLPRIAEPIADKVAFVAEFIALMDRTADKPNPRLIPEGANITQVVIKGNRASAVITKPRGDRVIDCPATLIRIKGEWRFSEIEGLAN